MGLYGNRNSFNDRGLREIVHDKSPPKRALMFDLLVVDEAQDCTPLLYQLVVKMLRDCSASRAHNGAPPPQVGKLLWSHEMLIMNEEHMRPPTTWQKLTAESSL
jgi:hypothetical protein